MLESGVRLRFDLYYKIELSESYFTLSVIYSIFIIYLVIFINLCPFAMVSEHLLRLQRSVPRRGLY